MRWLACVLLCAACGDSEELPVQPSSGDDVTGMSSELPEPDAGVPGFDGGVIVGDGGIFLDAGTVPLDAFAPLPDAGSPLSDSGIF